MTVVCDTSGLLALYDIAEPDHRSCARAVERLDPPFVVSPLVIAELDHLVRSRLGGRSARAVLDELSSGAYEIVPLTRGDLQACAALDEQYADLGLGVTDASLVVLADQWRTHDLLTLDQRHFRAVTACDGRPFRLHPADQPPET